ncbi:hypothetical protein FPOAC1_010019 [Fusarium poae]|uniref:hypothetical protein n=1 Tax=Fusarium poae TaxID=36050 RepID=UPI001CE8F4E3|nr:hypothetical protein FPOAC1_010019 [Fusarium poae]KAG8670593.1 hypothetical protein FPOAC1_010019 [Fusarium poae]
MSDSDAVELQPKRLPPSAEKGSDWEPLVESKSGLDIPGRSSVQPLEPRYVETPENETHSEDIPALNYTRYSQWFTRPSQKSILETTITTDTSFTELVPYTNVTYSNYEATRRPISYKKTPGYGTVATCPLSIVARNIGTLRYGAGRYLELITARNNVNGSSTLGKWKQPLVITKCSSSKIVDGVASFSFGPPFFKETAERRFQHVKIPLAKHPWLLNLNTTENLSTSADPLGYSFLNIKDEVKLPISADIMFATVMNETVDSMKGTLPLRPSAVQFTLCLVSALWTEADVWLEPQRSKDALSHLSFANGEEVARIAESFGTRDFIDIHEDWMTGIGSVPTSTNMSSYDEALRFCLAATPYGIWEPTVSSPNPILNSIRHLQITVRLRLPSPDKPKSSEKAAMLRWRQCCEALERSDNLDSVYLWLDADPRHHLYLSKSQGNNTSPYIFGGKLAVKLTADAPLNPDRPEAWDAVVKLEPKR